MPEVLVRSPIFTQFDRGPFELSLKLFQFSFEPRQKRKRVSCSAGKPYKHAPVHQTPYFSGVSLNYGFTKCYLSVSGHGYFSVAVDQQYSGRANARVSVCFVHKI
jgi:hypothetical protein